jgi:peptide/nickel transport system substrate-binding protein
MMYGTGPWMFKGWVEGQYIHLVKNPDYWNKAEYDPYYEEMYLRIIMEPATAVAAHIAGDMQAYLPNGGIRREFMPLYETVMERLQKVEMDTAYFYYITFQFGEGKVFSDKNARMAFEYCVDRKSIVDNVYDGDGALISSVIPANVVGFDPTLPLYEYNPEKAREYLQKSNYDGRKIVIMSQDTIKKPEEATLAIAENMRAVGFNVDIAVLEYMAFLDRRAANNFDMFYSLALHPGNDPAECLSRRIDTDREGHQYVNEELHDLIGRVLREMDVEKRNADIGRISHLMREEAAPASGICSSKMAWYVDLGVTGIRFASDGTQRVQYIDYNPSLVEK